MKKFIQAALMLFLLTPNLHSQFLVTGDENDLGMALYASKIPPIPVQDSYTSRYKLDEYILNNQDNAEKPILIMTWFTFCKSCKQLIDTFYAKGYGEKYNVVTLLLTLPGDPKVGETKSLQEFIMDGRQNRNWTKFMNVFTTAADSRKFFWDREATPLYIFADKDLKIYNFYISTYLEMIASADKMLRSLSLSSRTYTPGLRFFDKLGMPSPQGGDLTVSFKSVSRIGHKIILQEGSTRDSSRNIKSYVERGKLFLADGTWQEYDEKGKLVAENLYKEGGVAQTIRRNHPNGKVAAIIPVNGIAKKFDSKGDLELKGPMKNGLAEGDFIEYKAGKPYQVNTYSKGRFTGFRFL